MSQIFNADSKKDILNLKLLSKSKINLGNINNKDLMATLLAINIENYCKKAKKINNLIVLMKKKYYNFADKIFNYIHIAQYYQLFLLAY